MLQEGVADAPPSPEKAAAPVRAIPPLERAAPAPHIPPAQSIKPDRKQEWKPVRNVAPSSRLGRLPIVLAGVAVALLCAIGVFYLFFHRNRPVISQVTVSQSPVAAPTPAPVQQSAAPAPEAAPPPAKEAVAPGRPAPEPVSFSLKRSKLFEKIGSIRLRLVKAIPKRRTCDLYIAAGGPSYQKQAHLNKPVQIDLPNGSGSVKLMVTNIGADGISGSVQSMQ